MNNQHIYADVSVRGVRVGKVKTDAEGLRVLSRLMAELECGNSERPTFESVAVKADDLTVSHRGKDSAQIRQPVLLITVLRFPGDQGGLMVECRRDGEHFETATVYGEREIGNRRVIGLVRDVLLRGLRAPARSDGEG